MGWSFARLSRELTKVGRDIPALGLSRIEAGQRRVDVDDLTALAVVFEVSPASLMMPEAESGPDDPRAVVQLTGTDKVSGSRAWSWLTGGYPLGGSVMAFFNHALPSWERNALEENLGAKRD